MGAQGLDVLDEAVAAVGGGVVGDRGPSGAAKVQDDQPAVRGQAAEVTEVAGVRGTSGDADDRVAIAVDTAIAIAIAVTIAVSVDAVGESGPVRCEEGGHGRDHVIYNEVVQPGYNLEERGV